MTVKTGKRICAFFIILSVLACLAACGKEPEDYNTVTGITEAETEATAEDEGNPFEEFKNVSAEDLILTETKILINKKTKECNYYLEGTLDAVLDGTTVYYCWYDQGNINTEDDDKNILYSLDVSTGKRETVFMCDWVNDGSDIDYIYVFGAENGNVCFMNGDTVYLYNKTEKKQVTIKENEFTDHRMYYRNNRLYYTNDILENNDDANPSYGKLMCYNFDTGKKTVITDKINSGAGDFRITGDRLYYRTICETYDFDNNTGSGLYGIISCNIDGSDKKLLGDYFSDQYSHFNWSPEAVYYSQYKGKPEIDDEGIPVFDDSKYSYYAMDTKTGKKIKLNNFPDKNENYSDIFSIENRLYCWKIKDNTNMVLSLLNPDGTQTVVLEKELDIKGKYLNSDELNVIITVEAYEENFLCWKIDYSGEETIIDMAEF